MLTTILIWLPPVTILVLNLARVAELKTKRDTIDGPVQELTTFRLFVTVGAIMLFGSVAEYFWRGGDFRLIPYIVGILVGLLSFAIRQRSIAELGKFWSLHVEIRENHELVKTGPFRFMRHPVYFSMVLELLAMGVVCHAWIMSVGIFILYLPVLSRRVRLEETAMIDKFGDKYREYIHTTPAILPLKWN